VSKSPIGPNFCPRGPFFSFFSFTTCTPLSMVDSQGQTHFLFTKLFPFFAKPNSIKAEESDEQEEANFNEHNLQETKKKPANYTMLRIIKIPKTSTTTSQINHFQPSHEHHTPVHIRTNNLHDRTPQLQNLFTKSQNQYTIQMTISI